MEAHEAASVDWSSEMVWVRTRKPVEAASALPAACYVDEMFHGRERERVFGRSWVCVGTVDELGPPAASTAQGEKRPLIVRDVAGRSVIITTNDRGELRAFHNACRHRGTQLAACDGLVGGIIRCPYHRWGYNLDGTLVATPRFDEVALEDFDKADYPLHSVRVDRFGPLLFVCLSPETPPLANWLGDLPDRLAGYRLHEWTTRERAQFTIAANWKLISENFQEYYHLPFVHPELAKVSRVEDHYRYQGPGMYCGQCTTPVSSDERDDWTAMPPADGLSPSDAASGRFVAMFPNVLLAVLPNHAFVMILDPASAGSTVETGVWLVPPTSKPTDDQFASTKAFWIDINNEDIDIVERGQRGLTKGHYTPGRLSARFEEPLHRFHNMLADAMMGSMRIPEGDADDSADNYGAGHNPLPWTSRS